MTRVFRVRQIMKDLPRMLAIAAEQDQTPVSLVALDDCIVKPHLFKIALRRRLGRSDISSLPYQDLWDYLRDKGLKPCIVRQAETPSTVTTHYCLAVCTPTDYLAAKPTPTFSARRSNGR